MYWDPILFWVTPDPGQGHNLIKSLVSEKDSWFWMITGGVNYKMVINISLFPVFVFASSLICAIDHDYRISYYNTRSRCTCVLFSLTVCYTHFAL